MNRAGQMSKLAHNRNKADHEIPIWIARRLSPAKMLTAVDNIN